MSQKSLKCNTVSTSSIKWEDNASDNIINKAIRVKICLQEISPGIKFLPPEKMFLKWFAIKAKEGQTLCILTNFLLDEAPSAVAAMTLSLQETSRIATAFQNIGNNWKDETPVVANVAKLNDNGLTILFIKNTNTCEANSLTLDRVA